MAAFSLSRFIAAQDRDGTYAAALEELRAGRKRSHWMWFVFPQIAGLGHSPMSRTYAISSLEEAQAYLRDPVLGPRLLECARILTELETRSASEIFGPVDAMKLRSSMTLFARVAGTDATGTDTPFEQVIARFFGGAGDEATEALLEGPDDG